MKNITKIIIGIIIIIIILVLWNPLVSRIKGISLKQIEYISYLGSIRGDNIENIDFWIINETDNSSIIERHSIKLLIEIYETELADERVEYYDEIRFKKGDISNIISLLDMHRINNEGKDYGFEYIRGELSIGAKNIGLMNMRGYIKTEAKTYYFDKDEFNEIREYLKEGNAAIKEYKNGEVK
jgi:hypothetical protein